MGIYVIYKNGEKIEVENKKLKELVSIAESELKKDKKNHEKLLEIRNKIQNIFNEITNEVINDYFSINIISHICFKGDVEKTFETLEIIISETEIKIAEKEYEQEVKQLFEYRKKIKYL